MPKIKIEKVVSFSSEDSVHAANNILSNDPSKKWKCQSPGEKCATLVLQLEEASVISSIDIGNENSAYVEVLVSRSGSTDDFNVLLVMSSFMSPLEARQSTNVNKVRMFTNEQLSTPEKNEKWDRVKIVCTQPFNRHVTYGLSFITFHTIGKDVVTPQVPNVGKFTIRPESPNKITIGSLFARKKELQDDKPATAAAAIRTASLSPQSSPINSKRIKLPKATTITNDIEVPNVSRKRDEIFYSKDEEEPNEKIDFFVEQKKLEKEKVENKNTSLRDTQTSKDKKDALRKDKTQTETHDSGNKQNGKLKNKNIESNKPSTSRDKGESSKRKLTAGENKTNKKVKKQLSKPFRDLMSGVVIVISGIQNPDRANIRSMALSMGAKYKADWDNTCTHLICAFANTPKFNHVRGKGKIVTRNWIIDCHTKRKRLPWRRFALDKNDKGKDESEEEIWEELKKATPEPEDDNRDVKSGSDTGDEIERINTLQQQNTTSNGNDTEDEVERIMSLNSKKDDGKGVGDIADDLVDSTGEATISQPQNAFDVDTDEEMDSHKIFNDLNDLPTLPNFFESKVFYIDDILSEIETRKLVKYITACNGIIAKSQTDSIDFVITSKDQKLQLPNASSELAVVLPDFVYKCFNSRKILSIENFKV